MAYPFCNSKLLHFLVKGKGMKKPPQFKFLYLKDPNDPLHCVTSVGFFKEGNEYKVQIARCHRPDHFCKRIAREIIKGRYLKYGPRKVYSAEKYATPGALLDQLDWDFNPESGFEIVDGMFPLDHDE